MPAFSISKADGARRTKLSDALNEAASELEAAVTAYNDAMANLQAPVEAAVEKYNFVALDITGFVEDIANNARGAIDDKSESWQEGEKGQLAEEWTSEWENYSLDDQIEAVFPDDLAIEAANADDFDNLPSDYEG